MVVFFKEDKTLHFVYNHNNDGLLNRKVIVENVILWNFAILALTMCLFFFCRLKGGTPTPAVERSPGLSPALSHSSLASSSLPGSLRSPRISPAGSHLMLAETITPVKVIMCFLCSPLEWCSRAQTFNLIFGNGMDLIDLALTWMLNALMLLRRGGWCVNWDQMKNVSVGISDSAVILWPSYWNEQVRTDQHHHRTTTEWTSTIFTIKVITKTDEDSYIELG